MLKQKHFTASGLSFHSLCFNLPIKHDLSTFCKQTALLLIIVQTNYIIHLSLESQANSINKSAFENKHLFASYLRSNKAMAKASNNRGTFYKSGASCIIHSQQYIVIKQMNNLCVSQVFVIIRGGATFAPKGKSPRTQIIKHQ